RDDESEGERFDESEYGVERPEKIPCPLHELPRTEVVPHICNQQPAGYADEARGDIEYGKHNYAGNDARSDEIAHRIESHCLKGIDLLRDAHRPQLGGDPSPYAA